MYCPECGKELKGLMPGKMTVYCSILCSIKHEIDRKGNIFIVKWFHKRKRLLTKCYHPKRRR
jgi:hypothetical protein